MPKSWTAHAPTSHQPHSSQHASPNIMRKGADYRHVIQRAQVDPGSLTPADVLTLQRSIGNRATTQLLQPVLQAKLKLGPAGDKYEQEADRVSEQVVGSLDSAAQSEGVQRDVEEDEMIQGKEMHGPEGGDVDQSVQQQIDTARGQGQPLDEGVRRSMEDGFSADFSKVRVHTGQQADTLNRSLNAKAFTVGSDLFFRSSEYNPGSKEGQKLIAHELTHTVQQGATSPGVKRSFSVSEGGETVQRNFFKKAGKAIKSGFNKNIRAPHHRSVAKSSGAEAKAEIKPELRRYFGIQNFSEILNFTEDELRDLIRKFNFIYGVDISISARRSREDHTPDAEKVMKAMKARMAMLHESGLRGAKHSYYSGNLAAGNTKDSGWMGETSPEELLEKRTAVEQRFLDWEDDD
jgi:hypothetical protein